MPRWRSWPPLLLLIGLVACGGTTITAPTQALADPTATAAPTGTAGGLVGARASAAPSAAPTPGATATTRPAAAAASVPAATRPPAASPSVAAAPPQPNGPIPAGWKVYRGSPAFPFVVAYPPDWTVDDSLLPEQRIIYLYGPDGREGVERIDIELGQTQSGAEIDAQRDAFFYRKSDFCDQKGIEHTEHRQVSGVAFAVLWATCDASNELSFMQVASGLWGGDEWNVLMRTPYARKDARLREVFDPVLASLNIYAPVPP
ncbi:MAG TPA: hypothetical protein VFW96_25735 [Thermomicrobiales bacterium]|nr:hypothetical protein [Thermomicrobiales bacterium]